MVRVGLPEHVRTNHPRSSVVSPDPCLWFLKPPDVRAHATKMYGGARTRSEDVLFDHHAFYSTVY
jgi:hypothetical protein